MSYFIKIERVPYEEPYHVELHWQISNGNTTTTAKYYHNASKIEKIADHLEVFPRHSTDKFLYDFGSERHEDRHAYYFRFLVFLHNSRGGCSILFRFNNNRPLPDTEITEFCIQKTEPAAINELGKMFRRFSKLEDEVMIWSSKYKFIGAKSDIELAAWKRLNA